MHKNLKNEVESSLIFNKLQREIIEAVNSGKWKCTFINDEGSNINSHQIMDYLVLQGFKCYVQYPTMNTIFVSWK